MVRKVIIVSVHVRYFSFFSFFSLCQSGYVMLHQVTSGYVNLRRRDGTWSSTIMKNQEEREERVTAQVRKERERIESEKGSGNVDMSIDSAGADKSTQTTDTDKSMESLLEQIGHPTSRKRRRTRSGEVRTITLEVPENILEKTQQIATAKGISPQAHVDIIAAVISASGGNIDDFRLSRTSGYRSREKVEKVVAANAKSEFRKICQDRSRKLIVHFDGKLTEELA